MIGIKKKSRKKECEDIGKKWIRKCPDCEDTIIVLTKKYFLKCQKENHICKKCSLKTWHKEKGHLPTFGKIECPQCKTTRFTHRPIPTRVCKTCAAKNRYNDDVKNLLISGIHYNRKHGKSNRPKIYVRQCPKCNKNIKHTSLHYVNKNKNTLCRSCASRENIRKHGINFPLKPSFNPIACQLIDEYSKQNGYNCIHALNGGEYHLKYLNVWIDGYDKEKNVVVECYEPFHFYANGTLKPKDQQRRDRIIDHLKCKFISIKYDGKTKKYLNITVICPKILDEISPDE